MQNQNNLLNLESISIENALFNEIVELLRENFVALFIKESDTSLLMKFVHGQQFRITLKKV